MGAGPGDPGLITLRAVECLGQADLVLYDYLVDPAVLRHASASAELVCLGHHSTGRDLSPDEIIARTLDEARKGRVVVRLKAGDPSIFGRVADEAEALHGAGIPLEIISIMQALVIVFIAAPAIVRAIYRLKVARGEGKVVFTRGWGS